MQVHTKSASISPGTTPASSRALRSDAAASLGASTSNSRFNSSALRSNIVSGSPRAKWRFAIPLSPERIFKRSPRERSFRRCTAGVRLAISRQSDWLKECGGKALAIDCRNMGLAKKPEERLEGEEPRSRGEGKGVLPQR